MIGGFLVVQFIGGVFLVCLTLLCCVLSMFLCFKPHNLVKLLVWWTHLRKFSHVVTCVATFVDGSTHVDTYMSSCVEASCVDTCVSTCPSTPVPQLQQVCPHVWTEPQVWAHLWDLSTGVATPVKRTKNHPEFLFCL